jgi:hypothetical protein
MNYLPGLASNSDHPDLCLLSSEDYRHEHWCARLFPFKIIILMNCFRLFSLVTISANLIP